jgi:CelD/BcsL family acetyltransferase involved in cellulose biosynthesis
MMLTTVSASTHLTLIDPLSDPRWDPFVHHHPHSSVFHTSAWARVLVETYGYTPRYYTLQADNGTIQAAWPTMLVTSPLTGKRLVSLPFCDHCHPLITSQEQAEQLLAAIIADQEQVDASYLEVRGWPTAALPVPTHLTAVHAYNLHILNLPTDPVEYLQNRVSKGARNLVRQAIERGMTVRTAGTHADLKRLYEMNLLLRRRRGRLPQPLAFFEALDRHFIRASRGHIFIGEVGAEIIAAELCLTYRDTVTGLFLVSDHRYWQYRPNDFLQWKLIEWACEQGFRRCEVGRCRPKTSGVATFKEKWRFVPIPLPYYYYPAPKSASTASTSNLQDRLLAIFARIAPTPLFAATSKHLYRHFG